MSKEGILKNAMDEFQKIQRRMLLARKENALETYADLKEDYLYRKVLMNTLGVNFADLDKIKE